MFDSDRGPKPDADGLYIHPDFPEDFGLWDAFIEDLGRQGWQVRGVKFVDDAPDELRDEPRLKRYAKGSHSAAGQWVAMAKRWRPRPPEGEGWREAARLDSEEGPVALFVRGPGPF